MVGEREKLKKINKSRIIIDCILVALILIVALSNIWGRSLEKLLKLKPHLDKTNNTQVHFVDVGQGDAIVITFSNGKTMLIDSGTENYRKKLITYLDRMIVSEDKFIDYVVLTHPDNDHISNMSFIADKYEIGTCYRPPLYEAFENKEPSIEDRVYRGLLQQLSADNVTIEFNRNGINIKEDNISIEWIMVQSFDEDSESNEYSPVIIVNDNGVKAMFTGDISEDIEALLVEKHELGEINIDVDLLKLAHHGSKYSNSYDFLKATSPKYVVTSVGENTYGHPANDVIERILMYDEEFDTNIYSTFKTTKEHGNIIYTLDDNIKIETIKNIDDYVFVSYWVYTLIAIIFISIIILIPHVKVWYKDIRFIIRNKNYAKEKEKADRKNKENIE